MKLILHGMKGKTAELMQAAFAYACKKEGISNAPYTVELTYLPAHHRLPGVGCTRNPIKLKTHEPIEMRISSESYKFGGVPAVLETFLHEMVHVRQIVTGQLVVGPGYTEFRGVKYEQDAVNLQKGGWNPEQIPWEREAYASTDIEPEAFLKSIGRPNLMGKVVKVPIEAAKEFAKQRFANSSFRRF